jgi:hypothetical protein
MLGFTFFEWTDVVVVPPAAGEGPQTSPQVEISAEPDTELDAGGGALLTES